MKGLVFGIICGFGQKCQGEAITYTVEEVDVPRGYQVTKTDDGQGNVVLTNKHEPTEPVTPESKKTSKKVGILPSTGTAISLISLVLAFVVASSATYLLKKKKK